MSLRSKLFIGYGVFIVALIALGAWSAWRLRDMGRVSQSIIADNYDSIVAGEQMKESLERQDSAAQFALLGERGRALAQLAEHRQRFDAALESEAHNITEPGERELVAAIEQERNEYDRLFDQFLTEIGITGVASGNEVKVDVERGRSFYFGQLEPLFNQIRSHCDEILRINQEAMRAKSAEAAKVAQRWFVATLLIAASLVIAGLMLAVYLSNKIVLPLRKLTETTAKIAGGDLNARAEVTSRDEIGLLAAEYNRMAERIRQLRRSDQGQLVVAQQTAEAAIDSLYSPVLVTDAEGRVRKLNPAAEEIFGREAAVAGKSISEIARDSRIAGAVTEALKSSKTAKANGAATVIPLAVDGTKRSYRLRTTPMCDDEKHLVGAVTMLEDITPESEVDRLKSEFIVTASRELRTPLSTVEMGIHLLLENQAWDFTDEQRDILYTCRENCERLEKLMRDLLDLSRIEGGEMPPSLAPVKISDLIASTVEPYRLRAEAGGIKLTTDAPPDLPGVSVDREQIQRVIGNLLTNALRYTDRGDEIAVKAKAQNGVVAISVSDTGQGIPSQYLGRVFDKFVQTPDTPRGTAGLGLAIAKGIVEAHHGRIGVQSDVGVGTTFTITLPVET